MPPVSPNDILEKKKREKELRDAANAVTPAERQARFPGEVQAKLSALQEALPKRISDPLSITFTKGRPHDTDGGLGVAAFDFTLCYEGKRYGFGSVNVVTNGKVEFFDRTAAMHEPAVHMTFGELSEDAVVEFLGKLTDRHLRL